MMSIEHDKNCKKFCEITKTCHFTKYFICNLAAQLRRDWFSSGVDPQRALTARN